MKSIALHIGPRKCGKSLYVENELSMHEEKIYIGTLPNTGNHKQTIKSHIMRRGTNWHTYNVVFKPEKDVQSIERIISSIGKECACMLDGIFTWYLHSKNNNNSVVDPIKFAEIVIELIKKHPVHWRLVDPSPDIYKSDVFHYELCHKIQEKLINELQIIELIDWKYERL